MERRTQIEACLIILTTLWHIHQADWQTARQYCDHETLDALTIEQRNLYREISELQTALKQTGVLRPLEAT